MPELFHRLPRNVIAIFSGRNLLWHALAIGLTLLIVMSGFDWSYYRFTRGDNSGSRSAGSTLQRLSLCLGDNPDDSGSGCVR